MLNGRKTQEQELAMNIRVYSCTNQIQTFHEGLNLGHECCILPPFLMLHHSLLSWLFSVLYRPTSFLYLSLLASFTHTVMHTHKLCLSLPLALRQGFDGSIVTVLGSEHSDGEEEREMAMGGKKGWYEGEDR